MKCLVSADMQYEAPVSTVTVNLRGSAAEDVTCFCLELFRLETRYVWLRFDPDDDDNSPVGSCLNNLVNLLAISPVGPRVAL